MARDYSNVDRDYEHSLKGTRNNYRNKFFHDIDLDFILEYMSKIESGEYSLKVVDGKLQLVDIDGKVISEVDLSQGQKGEKGDKGDKGDPGEQGPRGLQGIQGIQGIPGEKGDTGATGATGQQGIQGERGEKGDKGDTGAGFAIKDVYDDYDSFIAAHPTGQPGDAYQVGTQNDFYTKSEIDEKFEKKLNVSTGLSKTKFTNEISFNEGYGLTVDSENKVDVNFSLVDGIEYDASEDKYKVTGGGGGSSDTKVTTYYVNPATGSDDNDGKAQATAFATIAKALSMPGNLDILVLSEEEPYTERITAYIPLSGKIVTIGKLPRSESITIQWSSISLYGGILYMMGIDIVAGSMYIGACKFFCGSLSISSSSVWNGADVVVAGPLQLNGSWHNAVGGVVQSQSRTGRLNTSCGTVVYPAL